MIIYLCSFTVDDIVCIQIPIILIAGDDYVITSGRVTSVTM